MQIIDNFFRLGSNLIFEIDPADHFTTATNIYLVMIALFGCVNGRIRTGAVDNAVWVGGIDSFSFYLFDLSPANIEVGFKFFGKTNGNRVIGVFFECIHQRLKLFFGHGLIEYTKCSHTKLAGGKGSGFIEYHLFNLSK